MLFDPNARSKLRGDEMVERGVPESSAKSWLRLNGRAEVAEQIESIERAWAAAGKRTRRNWWAVLSGTSDGKPCKVEGVEFPIVPAAIQRGSTRNANRKRPGKISTDGESRMDEFQESSPPNKHEVLDVNAGVIDQRLVSLRARIREPLLARLGPSARNDDHKQKSAAFTVLCLQTVLGLDDDTSIDCLTDGGNDAGIDAIHIGDVGDSEFTVTVVQSKYSKNLRGSDGYPASAIQKVAVAVSRIFDVSSRITKNSRLQELVTEVVALIQDGNLPQVRVLLCSNGRTWESNGQSEIDASGLESKGVSFYHVNHDQITHLLQKKKTIDVHLKLSGKAMVDDFDYRRVLVGRLPVAQIKQLFDNHGDALLDRNIRKYLGLKDNRVNVGIHNTLTSPEQRANFYFFNNGITAVCTKFSHSGLQADNWELNIRDLQIVNGGQTSKTIQRTLAEDSSGDYSKTHVLLRLYELSSDDTKFINSITFATNSQNPVDLTDLRSNDPVQERLTVALRDFGFEYKRKRDDQTASGPDIITSSVAAEAVMSVWRRRPNAAKFRRSRLFGDAYTQVFSDDLQAIHVALSVLIFRLVENERKRPKQRRAKFVPYASHFLAMVVGDLLLRDAGLSRDRLNHNHFSQLRAVLEANRTGLYEQAIKRLSTALQRVGVKEDSSPARIAAQFRRGDLLEPLQEELRALTLRGPGSRGHTTEKRRRQVRRKPRK
jgi:AIPR protein